MFNTLYNIASGIALTIGAIGASDDFDGAKLAQNAFFGSENETEIMVEQELTTEAVQTEDVQVVKDINEWNDEAIKVLSLSLAGKDELTEDEKLEIAVLTEEFPSDVPEKLEEVPQIAENIQPEGLSEEEFYCMLEKQFNDAMDALETSDPVIIEVAETNEAGDEQLGAVELQVNDDAKEEILADSESKTEEPEQVAQNETVSEEKSKVEPLLVVHGLPDIPEEDIDALTNQAVNNEPAIQTEQTDIDNVSVQDIPVMESIDINVPDVEAPELDEFEAPLFNEAEDDVNLEAVHTENAEEAVKGETLDQVAEDDANLEAVHTENAEEAVKGGTLDQVAEDDANVEADHTENAEEAVKAEDVKEADETEDLTVEPLEDDNAEIESNNEAFVIPSLEIPPAVISEQERAKISAEVDAIANSNDSFDSWIPRPIPVNGSVEDIQPQTKPEDIFIQNFSKKNAKESILENDGIEIK